MHKQDHLPRRHRCRPGQSNLVPGSMACRGRSTLFLRGLKPLCRHPRASGMHAAAVWHLISLAIASTAMRRQTHSASTACRGRIGADSTVVEAPFCRIPGLRVLAALRRLQLIGSTCLISSAVMQVPKKGVLPWYRREQSGLLLQIPAQPLSAPVLETECIKRRRAPFVQGKEESRKPHGSRVLWTSRNCPMEAPLQLD